MEKIIKRIIAFPFVVAIIISAAIIFIVREVLQYVLYGGELITYKNGETKLIVEIFDELKKQRKEKKEGVEYHD